MWKVILKDIAIDGPASESCQIHIYNYKLYGFCHS